MDSRETALERNAHVFLIFSSDRTLEMLRKYKKWSVDGTFFSSPKYFSQLFTLNVFVKESKLPFTALFDRFLNIYPESIMSGNI